MRKCVHLLGFLAVSPVSAGPVGQVWKRHVATFGSQNVDNIVMDYANNSVITMFNQSDGKTTVYRGAQGVARYFTGVFQKLTADNLTRTFTDVKEKTAMEPGSVFTVWRTPATGCSKATSTYIFDDGDKIVKENVVVTCNNLQAQKGVGRKPHQLIVRGQGAAGQTWLNYFKAFGRQRVSGILKDYTDDSILTIYNQADDTKQVCRGLAEIRGCFGRLFDTLVDVGDLAAPIQIVMNSPDVIFAVWHAGASGYKTATDTFILDSQGQGKVLRQNVVVNYVPPVPAEAIPAMPVPRRRFSFSGMLAHSALFGLGCWAARAVAHTVYDDMDEPKH